MRREILRNYWEVRMGGENKIKGMTVVKEIRKIIIIKIYILCRKSSLSKQPEDNSA